MKEFVEYLIKQIVSRQDQVSVEEVNDAGLFIYKVKAAEEDMGTIIGKQGHTIKSIRDLVRAKAIKDDVRVRVIVEDKNDQI